jgi:hypothetical protein
VFFEDYAAFLIRIKVPKCSGMLLSMMIPKISNANVAPDERDVFSCGLPNEGGEFRLADMMNLCPNCREMKMKFVEVGC